MGGHIWIESEGIDKGSTVTFIVKLGMCIAASDSTSSTQHLAAPKGRPNHGSGDLVGHKAVFRDSDGIGSSHPRYQRSL